MAHFTFTFNQECWRLRFQQNKVRRLSTQQFDSLQARCVLCFPSVLQHCWLGDRKGIRPVKRLGVGLLVVTIWLELCTSYSSSCTTSSNKIQNGNMVPANPGPPGKWSLKRRDTHCAGGALSSWIFTNHQNCVQMAESWMFCNVCLFSCSNAQFRTALLGACYWRCDKTSVAVTGVCADNDHSVSFCSSLVSLCIYTASLVCPP